MKTILKKVPWFTAITTLCLVAVTLFAAVGCDKSEIPLDVGNNVSFTACQQNKLRSSELSDNIDVEFTNKGVQITHYDFEVTCDFTTVNVNYTFVNGVLNITQQGTGTPNQAKCVCYTDVSYTIDGISQNEVNVIFINGVQVYCYNGNENKEGDVLYKRCIYKDGYLDTISIEGVGYLFINSIPAGLRKEDNIMYITYNNEDNSTTFSAAYPTEATYSGNICNFPDFAKEWEIPAEGKQIYYKGELYVTGIYLSVPPHIGGHLILTTLK